MMRKNDKRLEGVPER